MIRTAAVAGVYGIPWSSITVDGALLTSEAQMREGATVVLTGVPLRLDGPPGLLLLGETEETRRIRQRVARAMGRDSGAEPEDALLRDAVALTDGHEVFAAVLLPEARLAVLADGLPPVGGALRVAAAPAWPARAGLAGPGPAFAAGTRIDTPRGPRAVETLHPGDVVSTCGGGPQRILWTARLPLTGAELYLSPGLRPVRIAAGALGPGRPARDVVLSPDQRAVAAGPVVAALFACPEVTFRVGDLPLPPEVRTDFALREVRYHRLLLADVRMLTAEGLPCESLHPDDLTARDPATPSDRGHGRRHLSAGEAALLAHGLDRARPRRALDSARRPA